MTRGERRPPAVGYSPGMSTGTFIVTLFPCARCGAGAPARRHGCRRVWALAARRLSVPSVFASGVRSSGPSAGQRQGARGLGRRRGCTRCDGWLAGAIPGALDRGGAGRAAPGGGAGGPGGTAGGGVRGGRRGGRAGAGRRRDRHQPVRPGRHGGRRRRVGQCRRRRALRGRYPGAPRRAERGVAGVRDGPAQRASTTLPTPPASPLPLPASAGSARWSARRSPSRAGCGAS